jgi:Family of unknown function (DUF6029)
MKNYFLIFCLIPLLLEGQITNKKVNLPQGLRLSNQLEYSYNTKLEQETLENWLNLDYHKGIFTTGFRFEVFQPNDPNPSINRGKEKYADIAYKYLQAKIGNIKESLNITVGNFYGSFGRGMVLKSYEDRNVRVDNNLLGLYLEGKYSNFVIKALSGSGANINDERKDILHAADLEFRGIKKLKIGASFASNNSENANEAATSLLGFRIAPNISFMDLYSEYAVKMNKDIKGNTFSNNRDIIGKAFYTNLNFYYSSFSVISEFKYYDNFNFTSKDGTIQYNTAPAVIRDYSYILLNRHPHALNQNNEKGFQIEGNYVLSDYTNFTLSYGLTQTIGKGSLYNEVLNIDQDSRNQLKEGFAQIHHRWNPKIKSIFTFGYNEEATTNTKNLTPILETNYSLDEKNTIKLIVEHQQTNNEFTDEKYYSDVLTLEYLHSPDLSISFVGEMKTSEPETNNVKRKFWALAQTSYKLNDYIDLSLLIGSRQAGNICIGGVCRYEPEFEGVELKMLTRLY